MKRLLLAALISVLWAGAGQASSIFTEPPPSTRYDGFTIVQVQQPFAIEAACGIDLPWGCMGWLIHTGGSVQTTTCIVRIVVGLLPEMEAAAERNLRARCGGWPGW